MPLPLLATPPRPAAAGFRDAALFRPASVALIGDAALPETAVLAANLAAGGFRGRLLAAGVPAPPGFEAPAAPAIEALPAAPDLAVLCLPAARLEAAMQALAARGCFAAIVPVAAPDLAAIAARTGVRALGPDSFGLCVPAIGLNASLAHLAPRPGRLALVAQSAALARAVLDWAAAESVGFSHVVGVGGNASVGFATALDWLARDPGTGAVLLDLRHVRNRRAFVSAARAVSRTRPVVAIRAGARLADATGVAEAVTEAALRRAGVLRVGGFEELLSAAETLARLRGAPRAGEGDRIAIVGNGGGLAGIAADAVLAGGARLAELAEASRAALAALLPPGARGTNPLSLGPAAGPRLGEAAAMLAALPEVDAVVALHAPAPGEDGATVREALIAACRARGTGALRPPAPILVGWAGQASAGAERAALAAAGIAAFATPEAAVRGALQLAQDRRNRAAAAELPPREVLEVAPDRAAVRRLFAGARAAGRLALTEEEALGVLAAYGLPVVPGRVAASPEDAGAAAAMLGFPVVLKILSPDIVRKTEHGGVVLGLSGIAEVVRAALAVQERVRAARPEARLAGFLVQREARRAHELRLRLGEDALFGPWIGFGAGGTAADLMGDEAFDLPPLNLALAQALIARARRTARLLAGFRDRPAADRGAIAAALVRLSQLAVDFPEIATLSVNPLFADADGVLAVDAALTLRPADAPGAVLAIAPYPAELARPWRAPDGTELMVRPIRPEDAAAHAEAFRRLTPEDVRRRFFSALKELPPEQIARLTQIDYDREMAFIAVERRADGPERTVGVARAVREIGSAEGEAEFAVIVDPAWRGRGLARHLMERLIEWARGQGVTALVGRVLADNAPMLGFVRALGFAVRRVPGEDDVVEARLELR
ncbi:bifunctional acetate--CoA ligase family protein/GNAT family N-acetyltransferase [Caldovatus aquaticus]|uniref:GNAT family N-acetyltransferase n=1 Tax=Caldovatus aquaticus TaxID=2865671 RepID=A0ABS7F080_9PROT|nr:GNAT family N-acetyltransferase [Caldovatus aquaticus]MBW8269013.1 GNAT family N-acetyltransferase [Caldovatus aquaticus]